MSEGWGRGLLGFIGICWALALSCVLHSFDDVFCAGMDENILGGLLPDGLWRGIFLSAALRNLAFQIYRGDIQSDRVFLPSVLDYFWRCLQV